MVLFSVSTLATFFYFSWIFEVLLFYFVYSDCRHNGLVVCSVIS